MKLTRIEQVEKQVGKTPGPRDLKVIDHIDAHAARWLSHASVGFIALGSSGQIRLTVAGGQPGFASAPDDAHLQLPLDALDDASLCVTGVSFAGLFLVSGMDETLRVNGRVSAISGDAATVSVEECYLHCAKSFRRSEFWSPGEVSDSGCEPAEFVTRARFLVLATINSSGQADVSPKGDPANLMMQQDGGLVCFADRPGNRRIDSFRNIMEQPGVCLFALVPGCADMLEVAGEATVHADDPLAKGFSVQGKTPALVTKVTPRLMQKRHSAALARAGLWPARETPEDLVPSEIFKAHVKHSKESSLQAKVARAAVSIPGAMEKGLEMDYKKNMY